MNDEPLFTEIGYPVSSVSVIPRGRAVYRSGGENNAVSVRHLLGYEPFTSMCSDVVIRPRYLATSIANFGAVVRQHGETIRSRGLEDAAAVFLGNVLVGLRHDASWTRYGDEFPSAGSNQRQYEVLHLLDLLMDSDDATYEKCVEMIEEWARQ